MAMIFCRKLQSAQYIALLALFFPLAGCFSGTVIEEGGRIKSGNGIVVDALPQPWLTITDGGGVLFLRCQEQQSISIVRAYATPKPKKGRSMIYPSIDELATYYWEDNYGENSTLLSRQVETIGRYATVEYDFMASDAARYCSTTSTPEALKTRLLIQEGRATQRYFTIFTYTSNVKAFDKGLPDFEKVVESVTTSIR